jgi:hypothetical protein
LRFSISATGVPSVAATRVMRVRMVLVSILKLVCFGWGFRAGFGCGFLWLKLRVC